MIDNKFIQIAWYSVAAKQINGIARKHRVNTEQCRPYNPDKIAVNLDVLSMSDLLDQCYGIETHTWTLASIQARLHDESSLSGIPHTVCKIPDPV